MADQNQERNYFREAGPQPDPGHRQCLGCNPMTLRPRCFFATVSLSFRY